MSELQKSHTFSNNRKLELRIGDLTNEPVDVIVNAANQYLSHGGGVAGAIVHAGGYSIQEESDLWVKLNGPVTHAFPAVTSAGRLPCQKVIHAVGPVWGEGNEDTKLATAIESSFNTAEHLGMKSIAFPAISTGIFGFPIDRAANIFVETICQYFEKNQNTTLQIIRIILKDKNISLIFEKSLDQMIQSKS
jgi:O-acetyl-ADP-ribose deacetylase